MSLTLIVIGINRQTRTQIDSAADADQEYVYILFHGI